MKHLTILVLSAALALAGCATTAYVPTPLEPKVKTPANVAKLCEPIPASPGRGSNMGDLYGAYDSLVGQYGECAMLDQSKAAFLKSQGH